MFLKKWLVYLVTFLILLTSNVALLGRTNTVIVAYSSAVGSLDPHNVTYSDTHTLRYNIFQGFDWLDGHLNLIPELAVGWELAENGVDYTLYLRKGVKFQDRSDFDAYAVKANSDRLLFSEWDWSVKSFFAPFVASVEVVDPYTVKIATKAKDAPFLKAVCRFMLYASPASLAAYGSELGGLDNDLVGTGPFPLEDWVRGERVELKRFNDYWNGPAHVDGITYLIVPESAARVTMLKTGEVDAIIRVTPEDAAYLESATDVEIQKVTTNRVIYFAINMNNASFDDVRVRQALNYAVDVPAITSSLFGSGTIEVDCPVAPPVGGYAHIKKYSYDPEKARQLLAEAGYPDGLTIRMECPKGRYVLDHLVAQAVQAQLEAVGLQVNLKIWGDFPSYLANLTNPERGDLLMVGWAASVGEAQNTLLRAVHPAQANKFANTAGYVNLEVGRLMDLSRTEMNREECFRLYRELKGIIMEDAPWIFLYYEDIVIGSSVDVRGLEILPSGELILKNVWIKE